MLSLNVKLAYGKRMYPKRWWKGEKRVDRPVEALFALVEGGKVTPKYADAPSM
jgi:hypothetical protein